LGFEIFYRYGDDPRGFDYGSVGYMNDVWKNVVILNDVSGISRAATRKSLYQPSSSRLEEGKVK
jgi:hypothetical protein